jgi:hypothetical protein
MGRYTYPNPNPKTSATTERAVTVLEDEASFRQSITRDIIRDRSRTCYAPLFGSHV